MSSSKIYFSKISVDLEENTALNMLFYICYKIGENVKMKNGSLTLSIDLLKAYDCLDHDLMFAKLEA